MKSSKNLRKNGFPTISISNPTGRKRPLVPQVTGFQVCRAKVLAQGCSTITMMLTHRATNPASLKTQLGPLIGKSWIRNVQRYRFDFWQVGLWKFWSTERPQVALMNLGLIMKTGNLWNLVITNFWFPNPRTFHVYCETQDNVAVRWDIGLNKRRLIHFHSTGKSRKCSESLEN